MGNCGRGAGSGPHSGWLLEVRRKSHPRRMTVAGRKPQTKPGLQAGWQNFRGGSASCRVKRFNAIQEGVTLLALFG